MSAGGPGPDVAGQSSALQFLVEELDLEPPRRPQPSRRAGIVALCLAIPLVVLTGLAGARAMGDRDDGRAVDQATEGTTEGTAADATTAEAPDDVTAYRQPDWIARENQRPGTTDWVIPDDPAMWDRIRGYASATSVDLGEPFSLHVTTAAPTWTADAYRIGYYQGHGGRLVWSSGEQPGVVQANPTVDPETNMAEARWEPNLVVPTDAEWPPGMYLIRLTSSDGGATFVPLVVRDDESTADILVQSSVTTWQAYNAWGGANHYTGHLGLSSTRARVVSFDRPYGGNGSGEFFGREFEFAYFAERLGLDVTYWTDVDLHERGNLATRHRAVISLGHDEYYSTTMRDNLEQARDRGVNLAFLGANAIYRKIRFEPSPLGPNRRQVNYRIASEDPLDGEQPSQVTVSWRDAPSSEPESALIGQMYECNPVKADMVIADASAWLFEGTGLEKGDELPDAVGNEYDRVMPDQPTPENIQVLTHSPVTCKGKRSFANSTYYTAPSGAGVFAAGTFWWIPPLKAECPNGPETSSDCQIQKIVENILREFSLGPSGRRHPSVNNLAALGIKAGSTPRVVDDEDARRSPTTAPRGASTPSTAPRRGTTPTAPRSTTVPTTTAPPSSSEPPSTAVTP